MRARLAALLAALRDGRRTVAAAHADTPAGAFRCPACGAVSHHPQDLQYGYCARCHRFTGIRPGNHPGPVS